MRTKVIFFIIFFITLSVLCLIDIIKKHKYIELGHLLPIFFFTLGSLFIYRKYSLIAGFEFIYGITLIIFILRNHYDPLPKINGTICLNICIIIYYLENIIVLTRFLK